MHNVCVGACVHARLRVGVDVCVCVHEVQKKKAKKKKEGGLYSMQITLPMLQQLLLCVGSSVSC